MTINLPNIIKNRVFATLFFESGFNTKSGIYIPGGSLKIEILKNTLKGGYIGNTLLKKCDSFSQFNYTSNTDIRIEDILFSKCQIKIDWNGDNYTLNSNYNYLRLNTEPLNKL